MKEKLKPISPDSISVLTPQELVERTGIVENVILAMTPKQLRATLQRASPIDVPPEDGPKMLVPWLPGGDPIPDKPIIPVVLFPCPEPQCTRIVVENYIVCECEPILPPFPPKFCHLKVERDGSMSCGGSCSPLLLPCKMYYAKTDCGLVVGCRCELPHF